jgi:small-conductance mechanosensitive channel
MGCMNRSLAIVLGALALGAAIFAGSFFTARHAAVLCCASSADDLSWLRAEFHLSDAEMARIRQLHDGYKPQCGKMCALIAAKNAEVQAALGNGTNVSAEAQKKLAELGALRAQCQAQMLEHFSAVSQAMPPEQGRRYLAEMKRLTLSAHEQMEKSMSGDAGHEHRH